MPAFQLSQIKPQVANLGQAFTQPADFTKRLKNLFERYGSQAYRASHVTGIAGLIPSYHVPPMVLTQIEQELGTQCRSNPTAGLALADTLWQDSYLEPRLLAANLLGQLPLQPPELIISRLQTWLQPNLGSQLLKAALDLSSHNLRRSAPHLWLELIETWLKNPSFPYQMMGLKALLASCEDRQFENIPAVFRLLSQPLKTVHPPLQNDLQDVLEELARRTPVETAVFLRQLLSANPIPNLARLVRRLLPSFNQELQSDLREILRSIS